MKAEASNQKISWFLRERSAETLDISPEFQRNHVWHDEESSYLIDTILKGLPFPEIYIRSITDSNGKTTHEVVDGQQRITAIINFSSNDLTLVGDEVSPTLRGKKFENLNKTQRERFFSYSIVVRELEGASDSEIRDLFRRLNIHTVVANDQELRHAKYRGKFIALMEELANDDWWAERKIVGTKQVRRMEDVEYISELFIAIMAGPQNKKETIDYYYDTYEKEFDGSEKYKAKFLKSKETIIEILGEDGIAEWCGKSDFYSLFVAFGSLSAKEHSIAVKGRAALAVKLMKFIQLVEKGKKKDFSGVLPGPVSRYVEAVSRAATDMDRRAERIAIIRDLIVKRSN